MGFPIKTFGFLIPDALLRRRSSGANIRQRRFTLHVTFWAFLAQTLAPETSCRDVVRKVQAWWLLREIKISLGMDVLRCQTPAMVEKEVMMHSVSYNLIRSLMQEAAIRHQVDLTRISFKGTAAIALC